MGRESRMNKAGLKNVVEIKKIATLRMTTDNIQIIDCKDDKNEDVTDAYKLYGIMRDIYHIQKKERPDLTPKKNFFALGLGKTHGDSIRDITTKIMTIAKTQGMSLTLQKYASIISQMSDKNMISFEYIKQGNMYWSGIQLLKG